jgi:hypothetical protein
MDYTLGICRGESWRDGGQLPDEILGSILYDLDLECSGLFCKANNRRRWEAINQLDSADFALREKATNLLQAVTRVPRTENRRAGVQGWR